MHALIKAAFILGSELIGTSFAAAQTDENIKLLDFFARQDCAIGPATREAAIAAGFGSKAIDNNLLKARGWEAGKRAQEYFRLVGASIISGDMTFYPNSPLRTPVGFALIIGKQTICESGAFPVYIEERSEFIWLADGDIINAFFWLEIVTMSFGAGWQEGATTTKRELRTLRFVITNNKCSKAKSGNPPPLNSQNACPRAR